MFGQQPLQPLQQQQQQQQQQQLQQLLEKRIIDFTKEINSNLSKATIDLEFIKTLLKFEDVDVNNILMLRNIPHDIITI